MTSLVERINLGLRPISQLRPHEETVEGLIGELCNSFRREGVQRDPVVVDEVTGTILDGTHRVEALKSLGARSVLSFLVDYRDSEIRLRRWCRLVRSVRGPKGARMLRELDLGRLEPLGEAHRRERTKRVTVTYGGEAFGNKTSSLDSDLELVRAFDRAVARVGLRTEFVDEAFLRGVPSSAGSMLLIPPRFSKDDVLRAASDGRLFPPKSTLHLLPFRPLGVRYPLKELIAGRDVLSDLLKARKARVLEQNPRAKQTKTSEKIVEYV